MSLLTAIARRVVPARLDGPARIARYWVQGWLQPVGRLMYRGSSRYCPVCGSHVRYFRSYGAGPRPNAQCPVCGAVERHRLVQLYFSNKTDLFNGQTKKLLHIAPESQFARLFRRAKYIDYLSADLDNPLAMVRMDITDIQYPDETFDVIYCSHVLEHIPEEQKAMAELCRVLKPGGWAILQVPVWAETTIEDPSITTPEERRRVYGQADHVRKYGKDYKDRLEQAGFTVRADSFAREFSPNDVLRYGLESSEDVYFCTKPAR